jgi:hypothetical protein
MKKLNYGYEVAAHYWWKDLSNTFIENGYMVSCKDKCLFVCMRDDAWIQQQIQILWNKYDDITIKQGEQLGLIGMQVCMDQEKKKVIIMQPKQVARIFKAFQVTNGAPSPALVKLMGDEDEPPLLKSQSDYTPKCAMLMFLSQRTYPENMSSSNKTFHKIQQSN